MVIIDPKNSVPNALKICIAIFTPKIAISNEF